MFLKRSPVKYFIATFVGAALYCQWFVYLAQPLFWQDLKCHDHVSSCTKILFIADPQIQGEDAVPPPLSYLFNWDSDQYLKSTFKIVVSHFKPDVLVYLGDLMDEGSISTLQQFHGYVKRLSSIFEVTYPVVQVWIPGDNDIGGEGEPIKRDKVIEFDKVFKQHSIVTYKNISFFKVNGITHKFPKPEEKNLNDIKIVVSHYPLLVPHSSFGQQVNNEIRPNIYFCAHKHESIYMKQSKDLSHRETKDFYYGQKVLEIPFTDEYLYEIYVPTCSYRMGTSKIGYGVAILEDNNQQLRYTVLWSPTRFPCLILYLLFLLILIFYCFKISVSKLFRKWTNCFRSYRIAQLKSHHSYIECNQT